MTTVIVDLPLFDPAAVCRKCGSSEAGVHWCTEYWSCSSQVRSTASLPHLHRTCWNCKHQWAERPLDAAQSEQPQSRIRIVSEGTGRSTHVYDAAGNEIKGIRVVDIHIAAGESVTAVVEFVQPDVEVWAQVGDPILEHHDPPPAREPNQAFRRATGQEESDA